MILYLDRNRYNRLSKLLTEIRHTPRREIERDFADIVGAEIAHFIIARASVNVYTPVQVRDDVKDHASLEGGPLFTIKLKVPEPMPPVSVPATVFELPPEDE